MWASVIVELDPIADCAARMGEAFEALAMDALLFQRTDQTFHHAVLLWTVRRDELLAQAVAPDQRRVFAGGEDQTIVAAKKEWGVDATQ